LKTGGSVVVVPRPVAMDAESTPRPDFFPPEVRELKILTIRVANHNVVVEDCVKIEKGATKGEAERSSM
jgi:hypothetical protein